MVAVTTASQLFAADINEFSVRRQEVFEFTERPKIVREGDQVTIRFAVKAYCDATVAIEERSGFAEATRPGRFSDPGSSPLRSFQRIAGESDHWQSRCSLNRSSFYFFDVSICSMRVFK